MFYFLVGATLIALVAAWTDFRTGHISNRLTVGALVLAVAGHFARGVFASGVGAGFREAAFALGGGLVCALVPAFMYLRGGMGGGDVKLFAAIGAALHPLVGLEAEMYAFVAAAVIAPAQLAWQGTLMRTLLNTATVIANPFRTKNKKREIPTEMRAWFRLGPAIFVGTAATLVVHFYSLRASVGGFGR